MVDGIKQDVRDSRVTRWQLLGVFFVAAAPAFAFYWRPTLSSDEAVTYYFVTRSWNSFTATLRQADAVHATFYFLLRIWAEVVGDGAYLLRLPSVIAVGLTGVVTAWLASTWLGRRTGLLAGALVGVMPSMIWAAGEARPTALSVLMVTVGYATFSWWVREPTWLRSVVLTIALVASLYVAITTLFSLAPLAAAVVLIPQLRPVLPKFLAATSLAFVIILPLLLLAVLQRGRVRWIGEPSLKGAIAYPREVWYPIERNTTYVAVAWIILALALVGISCGWAASASRPFHRILLALWLLLPGVLVMATSFLGPNMYVPRYLMATTPALAIAVAAFFNVLPRRLSALGVVLLAVAAFPPWVQSRTIDAKTPAATVAGELAATLQPADGVLLLSDDGNAWTPLITFARNNPVLPDQNISFARTPPIGVGELRPSTIEPTQLANAVARFDRVWVVAPRTGITDGGMELLSHLRASGFKAQAATRDAWTITLFER